VCVLWMRAGGGYRETLLQTLSGSILRRSRLGPRFALVLARSATPSWSVARFGSASAAASIRPCRRHHTSGHRKDSRLFGLVEMNSSSRNALRHFTFMVPRLGPRHTGHVAVLGLVSCSAHAPHTHRCLHGSSTRMFAPPLFAAPLAAPVWPTTA
jgi:hypothetical protein